MPGRGWVVLQVEIVEIVLEVPRLLHVHYCTVQWSTCASGSINCVEREIVGPLYEMLWCPEMLP
jgi:hypothetical protein